MREGAGDRQTVLDEHGADPVDPEPVAVALAFDADGTVGGVGPDATTAAANALGAAPGGLRWVLIVVVMAGVGSLVLELLGGLPVAGGWVAGVWGPGVG